MSNNLVERLLTEKKAYHQNLQDRAKQDAERFMENVSYDVGRTLHRLREEMLDGSDGAFADSLLKGELGYHFRAVFESDPETFECDGTGRLCDEGIDFLTMWFKEVCDAWDRISSQLANPSTR